LANDNNATIDSKKGNLLLVDSRKTNDRHPEKSTNHSCYNCILLNISTSMNSTRVAFYDVRTFALDESRRPQLPSYNWNDKSRKLCACNTPIEESLSPDSLRIIQVEIQSHLRVPGNQLYNYVLCEVRRLRKEAALVRKIESQTWV
jgi:hypothetical protein